MTRPWKWQVKPAGAHKSFFRVTEAAIKAPPVQRNICVKVGSLSLFYCKILVAALNIDWNLLHFDLPGLSQLNGGHLLNFQLICR